MTLCCAIVGIVQPQHSEENLVANPSALLRLSSLKLKRWFRYRADFSTSETFFWWGGTTFWARLRHKIVAEKLLLDRFLIGWTFFHHKLSHRKCGMLKNSAMSTGKKVHDLEKKGYTRGKMTNHLFNSSELLQVAARFAVPLSPPPREGRAEVWRRDASAAGDWPRRTLKSHESGHELR